MKANNKTIIVTGAGSGMGRELTIQLALKGAKVVMVDIHENTLQETAKLAGEDKTSIHVCDISNCKNVEQFAEEAIKIYGHVDGLINNAGIIQKFTKVNTLDYDEIERVMNINFYGCLYMTKTFLPHLMERPEAHVVNISSMGGFIPFPGQTIYGASKAAVKLLTEGLYAELRGSKVNVTVVHPGAVNTHIMSNSGLATPEEEEASKKEQAGMALAADKAASMIINGMEKNKFRVLVGKDANMLDKIYRLAPRFAVNFITKKMSGMIPKD